MRQNADYSIDYDQSQLTSSAPSKNFLFTHPRLFLIFHHHRRKKIDEGFTMAHSESFDDVQPFGFDSCAFLRLNLFLTTLMSLAVVQLSMTLGNNIKAMQINGS